MSVLDPARKVGQSLGMVVGVRTGIEEPEYTVIDRVDEVEIRRYGARIAAETTVDADAEPARNIGFRRLARYIFGGNRSRDTIAMTAPVAQAGDGRSSTIRFFMPSTWTRAALPEPNDDTVRLVDVEPELMAVLRFTGDRSADAVDRKVASLRKILSRSRFEIIGEPVAWFYDPPMTLPFRRRNEVAVPVARKDQ
ncbi:heme-binding protein [Mycobacterium sp. MYCO198283]|uniref:SOUL family heme-binding protein n=1 Tax=Mycobacterium sp. MYCO198283 TaxID=2883505 RepID=UPI001E54EFBE|nr:heme-binding protein [Mycobacterium sp. MYCO198283]MCG5432522.1 heme-binding protein [Mycobacterium sp. MYCO198283]